jgi:hypothetical protein
MANVYIGIDVQSNRGCPYAVLSDTGDMAESGWLRSKTLTTDLRALADKYPAAAFGVDAPRMAMPAQRQWYWRGGKWVKRAATDKGRGRHCEVVIAAHRIANPQWTPLAADASQWMRYGFAIFEALEHRAPCYEVFPSAAYRVLRDVPEVSVTLDFAQFQPGPKDMLDAVVGAVTVREYLAGRGQAVGNGDGLGAIVLPRPIHAPIAAVMQWPVSDR